MGTPAVDLGGIEPVIAAWAATLPAIRAVWLIGSRARGICRPDSDVDLCIAISWPKDFGDDFRLRMGWADELESLLQQEVHLLTCKRAAVST